PANKEPSAQILCGIAYFYHVARTFDPRNDGGDPRARAPRKRLGFDHWHDCRFNLRETHAAPLIELILSRVALAREKSLARQRNSLCLENAPNDPRPIYEGRFPQISTEWGPTIIPDEE